MTGSTFVRNVATDRGAGLWASDVSQVVIHTSTFTANQALFGGALSFTDEAVAEIESSLLEKNSALSCGGGIATESRAPVALIGVVTFSSNRASHGANGGGV